MSGKPGYLRDAFIQNEDRLRFSAWSSVAGLRLGIAGLMVNAEGEHSVFDFQLEPTSDRVETFTVGNIGSGVILHCQAYLVSGTLSPQGTYVSARIEREGGAVVLPATVLLAGYLSPELQPSFPFVPPRGAREGMGRLRSITGTDPLAGVEISETVPTGAIWRIISMRALLQTDATVANRRPQILLDDGANAYYEVSSITDHAASTTLTYTFSFSGSDSAQAFSRVIMPLPGRALMPAGHRIRTNTSVMQAGDNWAAPQMLVEEWLAP